MTLESTAIGSLTASRIGLGCMGMSTVYGRADETESRATLDAAVEAGITLFDTADMYGRGGNERLVGSGLARHRDRVNIATKFGVLTMPGTGMPRGVRGTVKYARASVDASLRRLGVDTIDLYYLHRVDPKVPIEETIGEMARAVAAGKVREIGVSEVTAEELRRANAVHPISAVQMEYSLFSREVEDDVLPVVREIGAKLVAYSPLGRGMLTGAANATTKLPLIDYRRFLPRWKKENLETNLAGVKVVEEVARRHATSSAAVALAWLLRDPDVVIIPGTKRRKWLHENLRATDVVLSDADIALLDAIEVAGTRYASAENR